MPEIRYTFVASGGREVADTFRSIEAAAKAAAGAMRGADRAARLGGGPSRSPAELGPGASRGGPYRSPGGGGGDAPIVRATRATGAALVTLEEHLAAKRLAIARRAEEQRLGLVRSSRARIESEINREEHARARMTARAGSQIIGFAGRAMAAGGDLIGGAARESAAGQAIANRVSVSARKAGQDFVDPNALRKEFEAAAAAAPGTSARDVGEAAKSYIELTGDINTARASLGTFAIVASATGAKIGDVATAAASLGDKFDIKSAEDMKNVLATLAFQGKEGAIELKDVAAQFQRLAAAGSAFGLPKGAEGVSKLGGFLQIARQGTGSARMAATSVENVFRAFSTKGAVKGLYDKDGKKKDFNTLLAEEVAYAGGSDLAKKEMELTKKFGAQGGRAINPLLTAYREAAAGKTGKEAQEAGRAKVLEVLDDMARKGASWSEITKDAAQAQKGGAERLAAAFERLVAAAGDKLAPALTTLVTGLAEGGIDPLITTIRALADAATLAIDGLKFIGLLKPKEETPATRLARAQKELAEFEGGRKIGPETAAEAARHEALKAAVNEAEGGAFKRQETLTPDLFAARYAEASGKTGGDLLEEKNAAQHLAGVLSKGRPGEFMYDMAIRNKETFGGETREQKRLREDYSGQVTFERMGRGENTTAPDEASAAAKEAAAKTAAAADKLSAAADRLGGRATITGGTQ